MKKLIALLAVWTMVGSASAAIISATVTAGGTGMTSPYAVDGVAYDQYFINYIAIGTDGPNALELRIYGNNNIGIFSGYGYIEETNTALGYKTDFSPYTNRGVLKEDVGHSSIDSLAFSGYTLGTSVSDEVLNVAGDAYLVSNAVVAFAQSTGFSTFNPRLATIYIVSGTDANVILLGGYGEGDKIEIPITPEPATLSLLAMGVIGLLRKRA